MTIHIPLRKKISNNLTEEYLCDNTLFHKSNDVLSQRNLLNKYDKHMRRGFTDPSRTGRAASDVSSDDEATKRRSSSGMSNRRKAATSSHFGGRGLSSKDMIEQHYWNIAERVLMDTRSWEALPSKMNKYYVL